MPPRKARREKTLASKTQIAPVAASLPPRDEQPVKTLILPADASPDARIVSLPHPSNAQPARYLYCPRNGFYEFMQVGGASPKLQSTLLVPNDGSGKGEEDEAEDEAEDESLDVLGSGYIMEHAEILVATPMDPRLLLMPLFKPDVLNDQGRPHVARMKDDLLDDLGTTSRGMNQILRYPSVRRLLEQALEDVCERVDVLGDTVYRPKSLKMLELIVKKANAVVSTAWPASLEKYIQKRLEVPAAITAMASLSGNATETNGVDGGIETNQTTENADNVNPSVKQDEHTQTLEASHAVVQSLRLRTAIGFILTSYTPPKLKAHFASILVSENSHLVDFSEMNAYLDRVEALKTEAQALRSISDNISRKRSAEDEDELQEARAAKVRKKEEEEKKRKQESRATKDLKKVDTSGMKKLSSFFTKRTAPSAG